MVPVQAVGVSREKSMGTDADKRASSMLTMGIVADQAGQTELPGIRWYGCRLNHSRRSSKGGTRSWSADRTMKQRKLGTAQTVASTPRPKPNQNKENRNVDDDSPCIHSSADE